MMFAEYSPAFHRRVALLDSIFGVEVVFLCDITRYLADNIMNKNWETRSQWGHLRTVGLVLMITVFDPRIRGFVGIETMMHKFERRPLSESHVLPTSFDPSRSPPRSCIR